MMSRTRSQTSRSTRSARRQALPPELPPPAAASKKRKQPVVNKPADSDGVSQRRKRNATAPPSKLPEPAPLGKKKGKQPEKTEPASEKAAVAKEKAKKKASGNGEGTLFFYDTDHRPRDQATEYEVRTMLCKDLREQLAELPHHLPLNFQREPIYEWEHAGQLGNHDYDDYDAKLKVTDSDLQFYFRREGCDGDELGLQMSGELTITPDAEGEFDLKSIGDVHAGTNPSRDGGLWLNGSFAFLVPGQTLLKNGEEYVTAIGDLIWSSEFTFDHGLPPAILSLRTSRSNFDWMEDPGAWYSGYIDHVVNQVTYEFGDVLRRLDDEGKLDTNSVWIREIPDRNALRSHFAELVADGRRGGVNENGDICWEEESESEHHVPY